MTTTTTNTGSTALAGLIVVGGLLLLAAAVGWLAVCLVSARSGPDAPREYNAGMCWESGGSNLRLAHVLTAPAGAQEFCNDLHR